MNDQATWVEGAVYWRLHDDQPLVARGGRLQLCPPWKPVRAAPTTRCRRPLAGPSRRGAGAVNVATTAGHNQAALERALASGATAVMVGGRYLVPSRTTPGKMYAPRVTYTHGGVVITCDCQAGHTQAPLGSTPCWHGALAMVQEQAADRASFDGQRWLLGPEAKPEHRGYTPPARPLCPVCDQVMDRDVLIPPGRQLIERQGEQRHRACWDT